MATQDIERLIADLQKGQAELARRDREHDEHITILLGQVVTLLPEVRELKAQVAELDGRLNMRLDNITGQLAQLNSTLAEVLARLQAKE